MNNIKPTVNKSLIKTLNSNMLVTSSNRPSLTTTIPTKTLNCSLDEMQSQSIPDYLMQN